MNGRTLKFLNVIDEFSRGCLVIRVGHEFIPTHCKSGAQAVVRQQLAATSAAGAFDVDSSGSDATAE